MNLLDYFKTKTFDFVNYVHLTEDESRAIWKGRNHPDVRKWMTDPNPFSWESHLSYIESLKNKTDRSYWAVFYDNNVVGSMCLNPIGTTLPDYYNRNDNVVERKWAETGMFMLPQYIGKGLGTQIKKEFVDYILDETDIELLLLKTQHNNIRVIQLNESLGYKVFNKDDIYVYMLRTK